MELIFVTGNAQKFAVAEKLCSQNGIKLMQHVADIDEIQGEDPELIACDKARKAYELVGKPVVVGDDSWSFHGLKGFPGAYMKSMNHWFTAKNFADLTRDLEDRSVTLSQFLVYMDANQTKLFRKDSSGILLKEPEGMSLPASQQILAMDTDGGRSISSVFDAGEGDSPERLAKRPDAWNDLIAWHKGQQSSPVS